MSSVDLIGHNKTARGLPLKEPHQLSCTLNTKLVCEIVSFLSANGGPNSKGRAHHKRVKLPLAELQAAIDTLHSQGELTWLRPYHVTPVPNGTWQDLKLVDEVLKKKCDGLLNKTFGNDLTAFCCLVTSDDLDGPLTEQIAGKKVTVTMCGIHKAIARSPYILVSRYLEVVGRGDEYAWLKPYHMANAPKKTWQDPAIVAELFKKKCDSLLREKFKNDLTDFCCSLSYTDLCTPLIETHAGREISINMRMLTKKVSYSPYEIVQRYLEILGRQDEYRWFKPYHMAHAPRSTWDSRTIKDEVLSRKCDIVLLEKFRGDIASFCRSVNTDDLRSPLIERVNGREIRVSMHALIKAFSGCRLTMIKRYLLMKGLKHQRDSIRPYHLDFTSRGSWKRPSLRDEVLKAKCQYLIQKQFNGDLASFCCSVTREDLLAPLIQRFAGKRVVVSMDALFGKFSSSPYKLIRRYLKITGQEEEYSWFKPYHRTMAPLDTWKNPTLVNELLTKKCNSLLEEKFHGDLTSFCRFVTQQDLSQPLIERFADREIVASTASLVGCFSGSPYLIVRRYLKLIGRADEYSWFKPYHMAIAPQGTWQRSSLVDEVLRKKCDSLLQEQFNGSLVLFCCSVTDRDLRSPLIDMVAGRAIEVSMGSVSRAFSDSPYEMIRRYHQLIGRPFHYTPACFMGHPETRRRRQRGELSPADLRKIKRADGTYDTSLYGFKNFKSRGKFVIRNLMLDIVEHQVKDRSVNYLGLETEQFISLRAVYERLNLSPTDSLIVERDKRTFSAMKKTVSSLPNGEGKALQQVTLKCNLLERELEDAPRGAFCFNLVNLDYLGHISEGKEYAIQLLLEKKLLDTEALVFITLQDSDLARSRAEQAGYGTDQARAVEDAIQRLARLTNHTALRVATLDYIGGSHDQTNSKMLWLAYKITRESEECVDTAPQKDLDI